MMEGTPVRVNLRCCLWLALDNILGATKWSTISDCLCWTQVSMGRTKAGFYQHHAWEQVSRSLKAPQNLPLPASFLKDTENFSHSILVSWNRFSLSHQIGESSVYQIDIGSNLVAVLCLRLLNKFPSVYQIKLLPVVCFSYSYGGVKSHGVIRVRLVEFIGLKETKIYLCEGRALTGWHIRGKGPIS